MNHYRTHVRDTEFVRRELLGPDVLYGAEPFEETDATARPHPANAPEPGTFAVERHRPHEAPKAFRGLTGLLEQRRRDEKPDGRTLAAQLLATEDPLHGRPPRSAAGLVAAGHTGGTLRHPPLGAF